MSLLNVLRAGVKIADTVTKTLQANVFFERMTGTDPYGGGTYAEGMITLKAIVDWKQEEVRRANGVLSLAKVSVQFLDVAALSAATGGRGIQEADRIVLPSGETGEILSVDGFIDAGTSQPIATRVFM